MLIGREAETARLGQLLAAARLGTSGALLLRGVAGIGKTALLAQAEAEAASEGFLVLRATGIESEEELPYATLHQLLRPLEDRIGGLAELQAQALRGALGLGEGRQSDRFLVGVGTLTLLADAAEHQPVLALLDDASWFDRASLDALSFTARRLHAEGVALLFAVRDEPDRRFVLPGVKELRVDPLDDADAQQLLGNGVDARRRDEVIARAAGNPLALIELGRATANGTPVATGAEQAYVDRIRGLPDDTRSLLLLAAADTTTSLAVVGAAAAELGIDGAAALEPAETAGLVHASGGGIEFRHPLVRSAAYHTAPFAQRARAHLALAAVLTADEDADRRAWHRASAVLGADDDVATDLERTADRALARDGHAAASAALERAAQLTADGDARARRLVAAARDRRPRRRQRPRARAHRARGVAHRSGLRGRGRAHPRGDRPAPQRAARGVRLVPEGADRRSRRSARGRSPSGGHRHRGVRPEPPVGPPRRAARARRRRPGEHGRGAVRARRRARLLRIRGRRLRRRVPGARGGAAGSARSPRTRSRCCTPPGRPPTRATSCSRQCSRHAPTVSRAPRERSVR